MPKSTAKQLELLIREAYITSFPTQIKHDIVCRQIAKIFEANSVAILLYKSSENNLVCAGKYIDAGEHRANVKNISSAQNVIPRVMKYIDILEFYVCNYSRVRDQTKDEIKDIKKVTEKELEELILNKLFEEYFNHNLFDQTIKNIKDFTELFTNNQKELLKAYDKYKKVFSAETHPVNPNKSLSGIFYYILHHKSKPEKWETSYKKIIQKGGGQIYDSQLCILNLDTKPDFLKRCRSNLQKKLNIEIGSDGYFVAIPITDKNNRFIGLLRVVFGLNTIKKITGKNATVNDLISKLYDFLLTNEIFDLVGRIGDNLHHNDLFTGYRSITLKKSLNREFDNKNLLANELADVINSYGCLIRISNFGKNARIVGHSISVKKYYNSILNNDPYVQGGQFNPVFVDLFYSEKSNKIRLSKGNDATGIVGILVSYDLNDKIKLKYYYLDDSLRVIVSSNWPSYLSGIKHKLEGIFLSAYPKFKLFEISEILIMPIEEEKFGLITLANTVMRPIVVEDVEMILSVERRVGLELKERKEHEKAKIDLKIDALVQSSRILLHQLGSPILSLQSHTINIMKNETPPNLRQQRLEEMVDTYQDFLDMLGTQQFFFNLVKGGKIAINQSSFNFHDFVQSKVRAYKLRAKKERDCEIIIENDNRTSISEINTDRALLGHVLQCLVDNAIKYSFTQRQRTINNIKMARIIIEINIIGNTFLLSVTNWGCTIERYEMSKITDLEYRGAHSNTFDETGNGIGLYVVDQILKLLSGKLQIKHNEFRTEFTAIFQLSNFFKK